MTRERRQGLIFVVLAAIALLFSVYSAPLSQQTELLAITLLIVVFGVPHGALDPVFAKNLLPLETTFRWVTFVFFYLLLALLVIIVWWFSPFIFLALFLVFSIFHFSGDLAQGASVPLRFLYGAACIVLPAALHATQLGEIFTLLLGQKSGAYLADFLHVLAWPWLTALCIAAVLTLPRDWLTSLEIFAVSILSLVLSPLLGFTLFFCGMHSARHIIRSVNYANMSMSAVVNVAVLPLFAVAVIVTLSWLFLPASPLDERIIQFVFVGLAALTVPHMILVERIRFSGWRNKSPSR